MALFVEWFWIRKFLFLSEGANIIRQWGYGDDAPGCVWGIPNLHFEAWDWGHLSMSVHSP